MKYNKRYLNTSELTKWDEYVAAHPRGNFLQTSHWSRVKSISGWGTEALVLDSGSKIVAGALIFELKLPLGQSLRYVPYGPLWSEEERGARDQLLRELSEDQAYLVLRLEPYYEHDEKLALVLRKFGFTPTKRSYQPEETIVLDLTKKEEELTSEMRPTTRRYIRQAERAGLSVREDSTGAHLDRFYEIMKDVSSRVGFGIHGRDYYQKIFQEFGSSAKLFHVVQGEKILGSYFLLTQENRAWELYGGVLADAQDLRANYLLKWEVIRAMKALGVTYYDQWGVAPEGEAGHALIGVTYFKEGFGGRRVKLMGAYELPFQPVAYRLLMTLSKAASLVRSFRDVLHG